MLKNGVKLEVFKRNRKFGTKGNEFGNLQTCLQKWQLELASALDKMKEKLVVQTS